MLPEMWNLCHAEEAELDLRSKRHSNMLIPKENIPNESGNGMPVFCQLQFRMCPVGAEAYRACILLMSDLSLARNIGFC